MWQDPVVAETRALRDEYARRFNYDANAIYEDLLAKQASHPERMVSLPPRKPVVIVADAQLGTSIAPTNALEHGIKWQADDVKHC